MRLLATLLVVFGTLHAHAQAELFAYDAAGNQIRYTNFNGG